MKCIRKAKTSSCTISINPPPPAPYLCPTEDLTNQNTSEASRGSPRRGPRQRLTPPDTAPYCEEEKVERCFKDINQSPCLLQKRNLKVYQLQHDVLAVLHDTVHNVVHYSTSEGMNSPENEYTDIIG